MAKPNIDKNVNEEEFEEEVDDEEEEPAAVKKGTPRSLVRIVVPVIVLLLCCTIPIILNMLGIVKIPGLSSSSKPKTPVAKTTITTTTTLTASKTTVAMTGTAAMVTPETLGKATVESTALGVATSEIVAAPTTDSQSQPTTEVPPTPTLLVVQGPTATPLPLGMSTATPPPLLVDTAETKPTETVVVANGCEQNQPPTAQVSGPQQAMMGKGQAMTNFEAISANDPDGSITMYQWDFGDGQSGSGATVTHGYKTMGNYVVTLMVTDNCGAMTPSTADVTIIGPTPPIAESTPPPPPAPTNPIPDESTVGFCHKVQQGQTLYGIAAYYGVSWPDLAAVNEVRPEYFVISGQGLFIPTGEIKSGNHVYQVEADDTLSSLAYQCGLAVADLATANQLTPDQTLAPGQVIIIPLWH